MSKVRTWKYSVRNEKINENIHTDVTNVELRINICVVFNNISLNIQLFIVIAYFLQGLDKKIFLKVVTF